MKLVSKLEDFYLSILAYAGMTVEEGLVYQDTDDKTPIRLKNGNQLAIPYDELLDNPKGLGFFHPANENYKKPESEVFTLFKNHLVLNLNARLSMVMGLITHIAANPSLQKSIKSSETIKLLQEVGEVDASLETWVTDTLLSKAQEERGVAPFVNIFLKKDAEIGGTVYGAIGKVKFRLYEDVVEALDKQGKDYRIFGSKARKKDLNALSNVLEAIFPSIHDESLWSEGTDNKIFRYLNVLLKASYLVSKRLNDIVVELGKDLKDNDLWEPLIANLDWADYLEDLYGMATEIRIIPNQDDILAEAISRIDVDEGESVTAEAIDKSRARPKARPAARPAERPTKHQPPVIKEAPKFNPGMARPEPRQPEPVQEPADAPVGVNALYDQLAEEIASPRARMAPAYGHYQPEPGYPDPYYQQAPPPMARPYGRHPQPMYHDPRAQGAPVDAYGQPYYEEPGVMDHSGRYLPPPLASAPYGRGRQPHYREDPRAGHVPQWAREMDAGFDNGMSHRRGRDPYYDDYYGWER